MNKIATYLNEHLTGEVITEGAELEAVSVDGGVLLERPEMVAHAANTSDIRKIARFCWQLAEKGHVLTITPRGAGAGGMSAAIGSGIIVSEQKYMNRVVGIDVKQRLIHVQAGAPYIGVAMALSTHRGLTLPYTSPDGFRGTIGGAIASGAVGFLHGRYGTVGDAVQQLEVVLASGEVFQTGRLSKRDLNAKKGLQTLEGEIYRQIDNVITDNADLIKTLSGRLGYDTAGFGNIAEVKRKDGSFDLTPLFVGSQGSLGIISEVIMQAQFARHEFSVVMGAYKTITEAREAADLAVAQKAIAVELVDGRILAHAARQGKRREYAPVECYKGALMIAVFDDYGAKARERAAKKLAREIKKSTEPVKLTEVVYSASELAELFGLRSVAMAPSVPGEVIPEVFSGMWLSTVQLDTFLTEVKKLEEAHAVALPLWADVRSGFIDFLPLFDMKKVSDRQKLVKILSDIAVLIQKFDGSLAGRSGDGRLKAAVSQKLMSEDEAKLYRQIKQIFDPHNILNPSVKQEIPAKDLVSQLNAWSRSVS